MKKIGKDHRSISPNSSLPRDFNAFIHRHMDTLSKKSFSCNHLTPQPSMMGRQWYLVSVATWQSQSCAIRSTKYVRVNQRRLSPFSFIKAITKNHLAMTSDSLQGIYGGWRWSNNTSCEHRTVPWLPRCQAAAIEPNREMIDRYGMHSERDV